MPTEISGSTGVNKITDGTIVDADVTDVAASKLTGTIADARFPSTLPTASGANLTGITKTSFATSFYQTGNWTPVLSGSATATIAQNKYVRLGNVVHCWSQIQNIGNIPGSGAFYIDSGLPFAPALDASVCGSVMLNYVNINGGSTYTVVPLIDAAEDVYLYRLEDNDEWGSVPWSSFSTNDDVQIYLTYYTEA